MMKAKVSYTPVQNIMYIVIRMSRERVKETKWLLARLDSGKRATVPPGLPRPTTQITPHHQQTDFVRWDVFTIYALAIFHAGLVPTSSANEHNGYCLTFMIHQEIPILKR